MDIYVGNLSYQATEEDIQSAFEAFGQVASVRVIKDRETGRSKGFAFVEMTSDSEAEAAINALNGKELKGRMLTVNQAKGRPEGQGAGAGGRGHGFGGARRYGERRSQS